MNRQDSISSNGSSQFNTNKVSPLHSVSVLAENPQNSSYKMRLLSLWIDEMKKTGRIDYPELVQYLNQVYEVENTQDGQLLMTQHCEGLVENLKAAQADIRQSAQIIQLTLNQLNDGMNHESLTPDKQQELRGQIREKTQQFLQGVEYLIDITQYYVYEPSSFWLKWIRRTEDSQAETLRKWINDLNYIRQYIAQQVQIGGLPGEFPDHHLNSPNLRRLHKYLENAPGLGDLLGNFVQQALQHKIAGGTRFQMPKPFHKDS
ncbi:MAG: hypothetical protein P5702_04915 [Limnospira sp. PMC 1291.21]|uniref:hypothetical protein n=1 Tax=unclassified Limnospira TaxID=2642885 RepID=UPI0028E14CB1|nr:MULTISPECIES: hypothetical protein [unclassified Limnospira]MDT9177077.1 hypothetical protein [Limnospira sp. PMC 1238.20]MDT9192294.1 hypothetical protein [Limnospira sp. PMC 1245.20]MDT9202658.1 hypothetical protein [Limnospira sp. PMC 1243.20]MDT9207596.1 hypothetical protein [Limnospira sp. PMC 1252.20]MDT9212950.1 hypothetical protein [Limnospira sp. PMC 1256.20]